MIWSERIRVVFADDGSLMRRLFQETFESNSHLEVVGYAKSAEEVVGLVRARSPHIVLVDESLLNVPGREIVRDIRHWNEAIAIIGIVSATSAGREEGTEMIIQGANSFVEKPAATGRPDQAMRTFEETILPELIAWGQQAKTPSSS